MHSLKLFIVTDEKLVIWNKIEFFSFVRTTATDRQMSTKSFFEEITFVGEKNEKRFLMKRKN